MIKFRAWEIAGKRMVLVGSIDFRNKFIEYTYSPYNDSNRVVSEFLDFCDVVLMQSTGLFDKNGKEIFESDIVEWKHKDTGQLVRGIVKYDTELGFWGMTDVRFNDLTAIGYLANKRVTVLGNIYQNKELVEEK
ncbi:TPA: YopX family protein [Streptococcus suis]